MTASKLDTSVIRPVEVTRPSFSGAAYRKVCNLLAANTHATPTEYAEAVQLHEMLFGQSLPEYHPTQDWYGELPDVFPDSDGPSPSYGISPV